MQVHQREYVEQFIAGTLANSGAQTDWFPWSEALVSAPCILAGTTSQLHWPLIRVLACT